METLLHFVGGLKLYYAAQGDSPANPPSHACLVRFVCSDALLAVFALCSPRSPLVSTGPKGEVCCRVVLKEERRHMYTKAGSGCIVSV